MKRQKHVTVIATREVSRVKQILMVRKEIPTLDASENGVKVEVFSLPNATFLHQSAPDIAKEIIQKLVHQELNDEISFPLVPSKILPADEVKERFIVLGSVDNSVQTYDNDVSVVSDDNLYWISVQEVYYRLSRKQLVLYGDFKGGKYISLDSIIALSVVNAMKLLGS